MSELIGVPVDQLDYWTAKAQWWELKDDCWFNHGMDLGIHELHVSEYHPSTNGGQAMELVKKFEFGLFKHMDGYWLSGEFKGHLLEPSKGDTPEISICRAVIASVYGDEVPNE